MKRMFNLWLNIVTICLCIGAIAVGVYSAISVSLNIFGNLSFNMHNTIVSVTGTIYNLSEIDSSGQHVNKVNKKIESTIVGGEKITTVDLNMGDLAFYYGAYTNTDTNEATNKVYDIVFEFSFLNISNVDMKATFPLPAVEAGVTLIHGTTSSDYTDLTGYSTIIAKNSSITVKFALSLNNQSEVLKIVPFVWNDIAFAEFEGYDEGDLYVENGRLYVNYGYYPDEEVIVEYHVGYDDDDDELYGQTPIYGANAGKPMRWVAIYDATGNTTDFTNLTSVPKQGDFYFVSEYMLFESSNAMFVNSIAVTNGKNPNDYAVSIVRQYLKNDEFKTKYQLANLFNDAEQRELPTETITSFIMSGSAYDSKYASGYITNGQAQAMASCIDEVWLMNVDELKCAEKVIDNMFLLPSRLEPFVDYYTDLTPNATGSDMWGNFWTRSLYNDEWTSSQNYQYAVGAYSEVQYYLAHLIYCMRPAFELKVGV